MTSALSRLQVWYHNHCDGEWEHGHGVRITTLDNPGWSLRVNLRDTTLERRTDAPASAPDHETAWRVFKIEKAEFQAFGGPLELEGLIETFLNWATTT